MAIAGKDTLINAGYFSAGVAAGLSVYAALRKGEEFGVGHIFQLARGAEISVHRVPAQEIKDEHIQAREQLTALLQGTELIVAGDSQMLPTDTRVTAPDGSFTENQPGSMDAQAAEMLNELLPGAKIKPGNYSEPGQQSSGLLARLKDPESRLYKALIASNKPIFAFSIGPNDWQDVVSDGALLEGAIGLGEQRRSVKDVIDIAGTMLGLARGHVQVGKRLESTIPQIMHEIDVINAERIARNELPILSTAVLFPADFGKAYAISVGQPGVEETNHVALDGPLRRIASMVSAHAGKMLQSGLETKGRREEYIYISSEKVVFPTPEDVDVGLEIPTCRKGKADQHFGIRGQRQVASNFAAALVDWLYRTKITPAAT